MCNLFNTVSISLSKFYKENAYVRYKDDARQHGDIAEVLHSKHSVNINKLHVIIMLNMSASKHLSQGESHQYKVQLKTTKLDL